MLQNLYTIRNCFPLEYKQIKKYRKNIVTNFVERREIILKVSHYFTV